MPEQKKVQVEITDGCVVRINGQPARDAIAGEKVTCSYSDGLSIVGAGRGRFIAERTKSLKAADLPTRARIK